MSAENDALQAQIDALLAEQAASVKAEEEAAKVAEPVVSVVGPEPQPEPVIPPPPPPPISQEGVPIADVVAEAAPVVVEVAPEPVKDEPVLTPEAEVPTMTVDSVHELFGELKKVIRVNEVEIAALSEKIKVIEAAPKAAALGPAVTLSMGNESYNLLTEAKL